MVLEGVSMSLEQDIENALYDAWGSERVHLVGDLRSGSSVGEVWLMRGITCEHIVTGRLLPDISVWLGRESE